MGVRQRGDRSDPGDRGDRGNVQAFEVLLFLALLAVPLVLLADTPPPGAGAVAVREDIGRAVDDWLLHLSTAPDPNGVYPSMLDRLVAEGLQGNDTGMTSRLQRILPRVTSYNMFLDNGVGRLVLRNDGTPPGEAASAIQAWSPAWEPILAAAQVRLVDAERSGLPIAAVPLHRARGLQDTPGLRVEVEVALPGVDAGSVNLTAFRPLPERTEPGPGAVVSLLDSGATQVFAVEPAADNATLFFGVRETQGRALPGGTVLEVRLPPGWGDVLARADYNPEWTGLSVTGDSAEGWVAKGALAAPLSNGMAQFMLNATRPSATAKFHLVEARLGGGEYGHLQGLFVDTANATESAALPPGRGPFLSAPGLAPSSAEALVGIVVANPDDTAYALTVTRVHLEPVGGASLVSATAVQPATGWTVGSDALTWTGSLALARDTLREFRATVRATAPPDPDSAMVGGVRLDVRNGFEPWAFRAAEPGRWALLLAPTAGGALGFQATAGAHSLQLNATHRGEAMGGNVSYTTVATNVVQAAASDLARGLGEGWLRLDQAAAPLLGQVTARWDLDRLREELVGGPADSFKCYTATTGAWAWRADRADCLANGGLDWQLRDEAPRVNLTVHHPSPAENGSIGAAQRTITGLAVAGSATAEVPADAMLGTHLVELRADFTLEGPGGAEALQSVRLLATFDVHRPGGTVVERPLYDVIVQAWLEDWV